MAAIAASPLVMTEVLFSLTDPDTPATVLEYQCHVSQVLIEPEQETIQYATLCPDGSFTALGRETFQATVTAVQDWSADGFTRFCWEHAGEQATMRFSPDGQTPGTDSPTWEAVVTIPRPPVGGEVNTFAVAELVFPITGVPTLDTTA